MKRLLILCLVLIAMISQTIAIEIVDGDNKLKIGGSAVFRGRNYNLDFNDDSEAGSRNSKNYYAFFNLFFDFTLKENTQIYFELQRHVFGAGQYSYNTISSDADFFWDDYPTQVENYSWLGTFRNLYIKCNLPFLEGSSLKVGRQTITIGNGLFVGAWLTPVFGIVADYNKDDLSLKAGALKFYEGTRENYVTTEAGEAVETTDDADVYFVEAYKQVAGFKLGTNISHYIDQSGSALPMLSGNSGVPRNIEDKLSITNVGLTFQGKLAGLALKGEFDFQTGQNKYGASRNGLSEMKYEGMGGFINAKYGINKIFNLSGELGYGSGDDPSTADVNEAFTGPAPFYLYAWAYEYRFLHYDHNSQKGYMNKAVPVNLAPGLENTMYFKVGNIIKAIPKLAIINNVIFINTVQEMGGIEAGSFGIEIDNILAYKLTDYFTYTFIFSYVLPGQYMDDKFEAANLGDPDPAWGIRSEFKVAF